MILIRLLLQVASSKSIPMELVRGRGVSPPTKQGATDPVGRPSHIEEDRTMTLSTVLGRTGRTLAFSAAILGAVSVTATMAPKPAHALGTGAAIGIGLGAAALGTAVGAAAASPYYGYPGYYAPAPGYYGGYPGPARSCWSPYYGRYYPC